MNIFIEEHIAKLEKIEKAECWYIVKQDTSFWKQCYYTKVLLEYKELKEEGKNLEKFFTRRIQEINAENPSLELSETSRALRASYFYGLLVNDGTKYETAEATDVYKTILNKTSGNFEKTELYSEIILEQIEKIFISSVIDEKSDSLRQNFNIFPIMFLYKILLEIGISTGDYVISKNEYKYFLLTQDNYNNYLDTLILIKESRKDKNVFNKLKEFNTKLDNRFNRVLENLDSLEIDKNTIRLKESYIQHAIRIVNNIDYLNDLAKKDYLDLLCHKNKELSTEIETPYNRIFFGAPGTGKSYLLNKESEQFGDNCERVTFHPNYSYGNFVGSFKPFPKKNDNGDESITYEYIPGPLMRTLVKALKNPNENHLLIIEEINRANVSAVFGDFFQLLDRDKDGQSEYAITTSEEVRKYLDKEGVKPNEELKLPNNLYLWSTMNSADQGVMPMDTAFKRRWDFTYIGVNDSQDTLDKEKTKFYINQDKDLAYWNDFRKAVNKLLSTYCNVPEDKLMGPYFISKTILESGDPTLITNTIKHKVLMYLYDDVVRANRSKLFKKDKAETFSSLCDSFLDDGITMFEKTLDLTTIESNKSLNEDTSEIVDNSGNTETSKIEETE